MTRVTIDPDTCEKLNGLAERLEICDGSGEILGYFTPACERSIYDGVDSPLSEEELQRRSSNEGGRTWAEIKADLERRE